MNQRQAVVFVIFMNDAGLLHQAPRYIIEKIEEIEKLGAPEGMLDELGLMKFRMYAKQWKRNWDGVRDWNFVPLGMFDEVTGEPTEKGLAIAKQREEVRKKWEKEKEVKE